MAIGAVMAQGDPESWVAPADAITVCEGSGLTAWYSPGYAKLYLVDAEDPEMTYLVATFTNVTDRELAEAYAARHLRA